MGTKIKIIILVLVVALIGAGFYFKNDLLLVYQDLGNRVQAFQKSDLGNTISEATKEILTPPPLTIGGKQNTVILTKANILSETNLQRQENGNLPALIENAKLDATAKAKVDDLFKNQYFEHVSPSGVGPGELAQSYGYNYIVEGENLILGNFANEKDLVQAWMNSPGHRANILNNRYTEIGVAIVKGTYQGEITWIGVQEFGLPLASCPSPDVTIKLQIDTNQGQLNQLSAEIDAKRAQMNGSNQQEVDDYNALVDEYNQLAAATKKLIAQYNNQVNAFNSCVAGK